MRDEERRDGDRRHVVQHLRPGGQEADGLVEGVAREAGGAAGLRVADRSLGVRRSRRGEEEPGDHEYDRRQPERVERGDAEGVVDGRADVAVGRGEQRRRSQDAFEPFSAPVPADDPSLSLGGAHGSIGHTNSRRRRLME